MLVCDPSSPRAFPAGTTRLFAKGSHCRSFVASNICRATVQHRASIFGARCVCVCLCISRLPVQDMAPHDSGHSCT
jgi:hypothetical protein